MYICFVKSLIENVDYYIENGKYVFTEKYLKERGYCCKSGCRHCPYGFKKKSFYSFLDINNSSSEKSTLQNENPETS